MHTQRGQTMVEYILLLAFVVMIMVRVGISLREILSEGGKGLKTGIEGDLHTGVGFK